MILRSGGAGQGLLKIERLRSRCLSQSQKYGPNGPRSTPGRNPGRPGTGRSGPGDYRGTVFTAQGAGAPISAVTAGPARPAAQPRPLREPLVAEVIAAAAQA